GESTSCATLLGLKNQYKRVMARVRPTTVQSKSEHVSWGGHHTLSRALTFSVKSVGSSRRFVGDRSRRFGRTLLLLKQELALASSFSALALCVQSLQRASQH